MSKKDEIDSTRYEPPVPLQLTISGEGKKAKQEIKYFLSTLSYLRSIKSIAEVLDIENPHTKLEILRQTGFYDPRTLESSVEEYDIPGGMTLGISYENSIAEISLKENLEREGENILGGLMNLLRTWTDARELSSNHLTKPDGEIIGTEVIMQVKELRHVTDSEEKLLAQIKLYQNMQKSLSELIKEMEKNRKLDPQKFLDEIQFYTNFGEVDLKKLEKQTKLACFLREVYGIIETENNVTVDMVKSNLKSRAIAANRHALMFLCRNKFPWVSSSDLGRVFSRYGAPPKNHATVLMACKRFNIRTKGIKVKDYPNEEYSAKDLLYDAEKRHLAYLVRFNKEKYKNYTIKNIFKFKPK